jgi:hypothetical protein
MVPGTVQNATKKSALSGMSDRKLPFPPPLLSSLLGLSPRHAFNTKKVNGIMCLLIGYSIIQYLNEEHFGFVL